MLTQRNQPFSTDGTWRVRFPRLRQRLPGYRPILPQFPHKGVSFRKRSDRQQQAPSLSDARTARRDAGRRTTIASPDTPTTAAA